MFNALEAAGGGEHYQCLLKNDTANLKDNKILLIPCVGVGMQCMSAAYFSPA